MSQNAHMTLLFHFRNLMTIIVLVSLISTSQAAPSPGDVPPPDIGHNTSGEEVLLPSYAGKAIVVTFWATWCPQCIKELPILEAVQNKVGKDQIVIIAINTEEAEVFRRAARVMRKSMHLELVSDSSGNAQKAYGVNGIPHMVIIGRDGHILQVHRGYSEGSLEEIVAEINLALAPLP